MKFLFLCLFFCLSSSAESIKTIPGCQGEGCDCLKANQGPAQGTEFPTIRDFTLYKSYNDKSVVIGKYSAGVKAVPGKQFLAIVEPGKYLVTWVAKGKKVPLKKGDTLTLLQNEGEGFRSAEKKGKSVSFFSEDVKLKAEKETSLTQWITIKVNGVEGYSLEQPFEGCLE